jgi:ceramide glucosyltransferase
LPIFDCRLKKLLVNCSAVNRQSAFIRLMVGELPRSQTTIGNRQSGVPLTFLRWAILAIAVMPLVYYLAATFCAWDFFLRRREPRADFVPPVSVLKPLKGLEREAYENLASFCRQDYPEYEILFAVDDERDSAIPIVERLIRDFPHVPIRLLVCSGSSSPNNKVAKLCRILPEARYDVLVISDGDIRVKPDYLRCVVSPFRDPSVGAVTCLYRGMTQPNVWSELEDLNLTTDLLASMLVARKLEGVRFALGATMAVTRSRLAEIGGFEALADCAADDHELGRRIAARGYRVELAPCTVQTMCASSTAREFFLHHLRWGVVTRHCRPAGYTGLLFTQGLPWSVAAAAVAPSRFAAIAYLSIPLAARLALAFSFGMHGMKDPLLPRRWWLIPLRDATGFFFWAVTLFSNRVSWRESKFYVQRGRLIPITPPAVACHSLVKPALSLPKGGNPGRGNGPPPFG